MRTTTRKCLMFTIVAFLFIGCCQIAMAMTGKEIIDKSMEITQPDSATSTVAMRIYKGDKVLEKEFELATKKDGEDSSKALLSFTKPTKIKLLTHINKGKDDDQWLRMSSGRVTRIAASGKDKTFVNSHFTYEDLSSRNDEDYNYTLIGSETVNGDDCHKIEAVKKEGKSAYDKSIVYVRKSDYVVLRLDIFQKGKLFKYVVNSDIRDVDGIKTPFKIVMQMADDSGKTELDVLSVQYNVELKDSMFNKDALR